MKFLLAMFALLVALPALCYAVIVAFGLYAARKEPA